MIYPFGFLGRAHIVDGSDGDLVINNGETVQIDGASTKRYRSMTIHAGGTLEIIGTYGVCEIGCQNNILLNGTILCSNLSNATSGTFSKVSPFTGETHSFSIVQNLGGGGGAGGSDDVNGGGGGAGGSPLLGEGGGGGGGGAWFAGARGGNGGGLTAEAGVEVSTPPNPVPTYGWPGIYHGPGSVGGVGQNGGNPPNGRGGDGGGCPGGGGGSYFHSPSTTVSDAGGGGGGGAAGRHAPGLIIYCEGIITGTGSIIAQGETGKNGGNGGAGQANPGQAVGGGGGGGGGAGGNGGYLWIYTGNPEIINNGITASITPGAGGANGAGGSSTFNVFYFGSAGQPGTGGNPGQLVVESI